MSPLEEPCGKCLVDKGFWAFYAFETARDMLLRRNPQAVNILTNADLFQLSRLFSGIEYRKKRDEHAYLERDGLKIHFFISDFPVENKVHLPGITRLEKDALKRAAQQTLFRNNCFFYDLKEDIFHDPLDSYPILKQGIIKTTIKPKKAALQYRTISLKTARVFAETGFSIDPSLYSFLKHSASVEPYIKIDEGIACDFIRICISGRAYEALTLLDEWGVLEAILPEVTRLKLIHQDKDHHPEGNGFWHTLQCLKFVKKPEKNLVMAILLHDIGKAVTVNRRGNGFPFPHHAGAGKQLARRVLNRFYFPPKDMEEVMFLVENHMILNAVNRLPEHRLSAIFSSPYFPNLLELYRADLESGYHDITNYFHVARRYRNFLRKRKLQKLGVYR